MDEADAPAEPAAEGRRDTGGTQAVDRALLLLRLVGEEEGPATLKTLCARSGLNRTTAWRLLSCLERNHFLDRDPFTKCYDLGPSATRLCDLPQRRHAPLVRLAHPELERLMEETQESCLLSVPCAGGTITISQVDPPRSVRLKDYTNQVCPLWGTSTGKVMLAHLPTPQLDAFLAKPLAPFTGDTIVAPDALRAEIARVRIQGYATVEGELSEEENGISAPVLSCGEPVALLSVGGPRSRFLGPDMARIAPLVCAACRRIEKQLAWPGPSSGPKRRDVPADADRN